MNRRDTRTASKSESPDRTALYRGDPDPTRDVVGIVGTRPATVDDLVPLLRKRLLFLLIVFTTFYVVIAVLLNVVYSPGGGSPIDTWANAGTTAACVALTIVLACRPRMTLRQLRAVEVLLFAVFASRMVLRGYVELWSSTGIDHVKAWIAAGDVTSARQALGGIAARLTSAGVLFVVAYGVIVPNTWRRCAIVVALFTSIPIGMWLVGCIDRDLPTEYWFPFVSVIAFLVHIQMGVLSVYGAYRIESSRQEAAEARRLGQYILREKIGGGGMGEVYLAEHSLLRRPCAIKLIRPERAGDPAMLQRFEREVQATAALTHPNTVQVFDYGHTPDGTFYYVMEYLPGLTLEELVKRNGPLAPERAIHFLRQLCGALGEAHATGLTHRDIKPGNVIVCERGRVPDVVKLLDFGLVHSHTEDDSRLTQAGALLGTPAFLSPEQAAGGETVDARSDIYGLGALAYFLLTGQPPFAGRTANRMVAAHMYEQPASLRSLRPDVPADLDAVILRCLAKKPEERYVDVSALDSALAVCDTRSV